MAGLEVTQKAIVRGLAVRLAAPHGKKAGAIPRRFRRHRTAAGLWLPRAVLLSTAAP